MKAAKTEPGKLARKFAHSKLTNLIAFGYATNIAVHNALNSTGF